MYVPILLATSPLAAVLSVPTTTQPTSPRAMKWPAMEAVMSVAGLRSLRLSQAVIWPGAEAASNLERAIVTPAGVLEVPDEGDPAAAPR